MPVSAKVLYVELLKKALCCAIYDEPPVPLELAWSRRGWIKRQLWPLLSGAFGLLDSQVVFWEGWFKDTLPKLSVQQFAIIRLDGNMYGSTMDALNNLYPRLAGGGFCIIDDYFLKNCRRSVHDYREKHGITEPIQDIDGVGAYWRKSRTA